MKIHPDSEFGVGEQVTINNRDGTYTVVGEDKGGPSVELVSDATVQYIPENVLVTMVERVPSARVCNKRKYLRKRHALTAMNDVMCRKRNHPHRLRAYYCNMCQAWHLTNKELYGNHD